MNYSKGITWFDDCRIPFVDDGDNTIRKTKRGGLFNFTDINERINGDTKGRFPANLLCSDDMLNDGNIIQYNKNRKDNGTYLGGHREVYVGEGEIKKKVKGDFYNDKGSNSRYYDIDKWFEKMLNEL